LPNIDEHCRRTLKKYGVEGRDIHKWLDEPSRKYAGRHREFRHDTETIRLAGEVFGSKYDKTLAENIALDHIMADHEEEIERRNKQKQQGIYRGFTEGERKEFYSQFTKYNTSYRLYSQLKKRREKKTWFGKIWFPLNEESSFWDCELCGKRIGRFKLKTVSLRHYGFPPRDRIRVCSKCRNKVNEEQKKSMQIDPADLDCICPECGQQVLKTMLPCEQTLCPKCGSRMAQHQKGVERNVEKL